MTDFKPAQKGLFVASGFTVAAIAAIAITFFIRYTLGHNIE
jgi:hypothetical protein